MKKRIFRRSLIVAALAAAMSVPATGAPASAGECTGNRVQVCRYSYGTCVMFGWPEGICVDNPDPE